MQEFIGQISNGLAIGSVYALLALGFSLIFGVANLINFAQGSLFMVGAYIGWTATTLWRLPLPVAALVAIAGTTALGLLIDAVALRPLRGGPAIAPLLSTLAVSVVLDQGAELIWGPETQAFPNPLAATVWKIGGGVAFISAADLLILLTAVATMALLVLLLRRTWLGRAVRATAQDADAAAQMGVDVNAIRRATFGLAGALGGIGGVLVGMYFQSIFPSMGLPYGLKGFAAALLGGIGSVPGSIAGGLLLGIFESLASGYVGGEYRDLVAYALLLAVLVWRPQGLLGRRSLAGLGLAAGEQQPDAGMLPGPRATTAARVSDAAAARPTPRSWRLNNWQWFTVGLVAALLPLLRPDPYWIQVALTGIIFALLAIGLTLISGTAGQISLGHAALFGVGAYTTAILARTFQLPAELVLPASGLAAATAALAFALPLHRLSGHAVAIATLAAGQIVYLILLTWIPVTRGPMGIPGIPAPRFVSPGAARIPWWDVRTQYWLGLLVAAVGLLIAGRLLNSPLGRTWQAIREDRLAAQTSGIAIRPYLLLAFGAGGFLAGLAGALYAYLLTVVSPDSFTTDASLTVLAMAVAGGLGNLAGAAFTGALLAIVPELFRGLADWRMLAYGLLLLLLIRFRPQGLAGTD
ncbi:MAG: ABC transporter permease [Limnochordaceae bacterium]|nr:ABC transporter permease [Limnochordaceae bacterium]